jgi:hypothetical protein
MSDMTWPGTSGRAAQGALRADASLATTRARAYCGGTSQGSLRPTPVGIAW